MNTSILNSKSKLECLILGHYDLGFDFHEGLQRSKGLSSGEYRNLRMDFITLDDRKLPFLDVLNQRSVGKSFCNRIRGSSTASRHLSIEHRFLRPDTGDSESPSKLRI